MKRFAGVIATLLFAASLAACSPHEDKVDTNPGKGNEGTGSVCKGDQGNPKHNNG